MAIEIKTVVDRERGCGWRKPGGLYLMSGALMQPCHRLPISIPDKCPTCSGGIKFVRTGWTWISPLKLWGPGSCDLDGGFPSCDTCPVGKAIPEKAGLLWIGGKHYTPNEWTKEALQQGVSRRITSIPKEFEIGMTRVFVAHKKCIDLHLCECGHRDMTHRKLEGHCSMQAAESEESVCDCKKYKATFQAAVFNVFTPDRIEYVVADDDEEEKLERLAKRGVTLVNIVRDTPEEEEELDLE